MLDANPGLASGAATVAPDGDADADTDFEAFEAPDCPHCGGILKPDVVFFGDSRSQRALTRYADHAPYHDSSYCSANCSNSSRSHCCSASERRRASP